MSRLNCKFLSTKLNEIKLLNKSFGDVFNDGSDTFKNQVNQLNLLKQNIEDQLDEVFETLTPEIMFMTELKKEANWQKLLDVASSGEIELLGTPADFTEGKGYEILVSIFVPKESKPDLTQRQYDGVIQYIDSCLFVQNSIVGVLEKIADVSSRRMIDQKSVDSIRCLLSAVFLNKHIKEDQELSIDFELPEYLAGNFGYRFEKGAVSLGKPVKKVGQMMSGGTINAEKILETTGMQMSGGKINVKIASGEVGIFMRGGRINVLKQESNTRFLHQAGGVVRARKFGDWVKCEEQRGGVFIAEEIYVDIEMSKGVLIANKINKIGENSSGGTVLANEFGIASKGRRKTDNLYRYDQNTKEYFLLGYPTAISSLDNRAHFKTRKEAGAYVTVIEDIDLLSGDDLTDGWFDGILVLRDLPEKNIGKGMKGGAVIVESSLSPDNVKARLSEEDRTGGVILMRIPDPTEDNPNNTKLIDLEDDWLEKR